MRVSRRIEQLPPYLFVQISRKIEERKKRGEKVISFAIGDPDIPTPGHIVDRLCREAREPANHRYPETYGLDELRQAVVEWYEQRFGVGLDRDKEVLPLIGSKEGIGHVAFCFIDPGDVALIPDPGYPVYAVSAMFAGGEPCLMPLLEENGFLPDLDRIPAEAARRARLMWINYPNNPTGAVAEGDFFERVVSFARKHDLVVCHDAPYTEVAYDGYRPMSFLQVPGAMEVGLEFHSWSKSYNMTGWRIGVAAGNAAMRDALMRFKSNLDSGIPQAIQLAAVEALRGDQKCIAGHNAVYQSRRDRMLKALREMGLRVQTPRAGLYLWARIPDGHTSADYAARILEATGVVVTPGTGYGRYGEGYIRLSVTASDADIDEGLSRLLSWSRAGGAGKAG